MCFRSDSKPERKIAEKDIICWKFLARSWDNKTYVSPYYTTFHWNAGEKCESKIDKPKEIGWYWTIEEGLHSYKTRILALRLGMRDYSIHKFIIPAGASYYENDKEYVSNQLIFVK